MFDTVILPVDSTPLSSGDRDCGVVLELGRCDMYDIYGLYVIRVNNIP